MLTALFAATPPVVGYLALPAARLGTAVPLPGAPGEVTVDPTAELVIIGNSKAGSDIEVPALLAALGRPKLRVQVISIGSATLPVYYAVIKNLVAPATTRPVVLVYATPIEILTSDLTSDRRELLLRPYLTADEPVIGRKLYNRAPDGLDGVRERAVSARDATLSRLADVVAAAVSGPPGRAHLDAAFAEVFGQSWAARRRPSLTGVPIGGYPSESAIGQVLDDTFVLELQAVCRAHDITLVYALSPVTGVILAREERRLRGMQIVLADAQSHADGWFVLPNPGPEREHWRDDEHMSEVAALANTQVLASELLRLGVLD
ncbi:MAG: hypothetical protein EXR71_16690 [Myxococcales bacterium]|nr:hypothetical protein [Myxococcales bacterium]